MFCTKPAKSVKVTCEVRALARVKDFACLKR